MGYTNPPLAICKLSSRSDDPSLTYVPPNYVDFVASVTQKTTLKTTKKHTVNDMSPHYMR